MEESKYHLIKAYECLESYYDMDLSDTFFEDSKETSDKVGENEQLKIGVVGHLKKLFHALVENVKKIINKMKNFFKGSFTTKKKKTIEDVKTAIKNNPELGKKTVVIPDFEEKNKIYNDAVKEIDTEMNSNKNDNKTKEELKEIGETILNKFKTKSKKIMDEATSRINNLATKVGGDLINDISTKSNVVKNGAKVVSLDAAIKLVDRNVELARMINSALNLELITLSDLEKLTGSEKDAIKLKKKIARYARNGFFHRMKVSLLHSESKDVQSVLDEQLEIILDYTNLDDKGNVKDGKDSIADSKSLKKGLRKHPFLSKKVFGSKENFDKVVASHNQVKQDIDSIDNLMDEYENRVKQVEQDIKTGAKFVKQSGKAAVNTATKIGKMGATIVKDIPTHVKNKKNTIKMY